MSSFIPNSSCIHWKNPRFASVCANQANAELFKAMKAAGCWAVLIGGESGVQKNLNTIRKGVTLDRIRDAVRAAKAVGLRVTVPFIFGIPGETYDDALKTIDFAIELDPDLANFHALTPFPGTPLHDRAAKFGTVSGNLRDYTYQGAAFVPHGMTRDQILQVLWPPLQNPGTNHCARIALNPLRPGG